MSKHLTDSLNELKNAMNMTNTVINNAQNSINLGLNSLMKNVDKDQLDEVQSHVKTIKDLLKKAKKGEDVKKQAEQMSQIFKNGSYNK
tara:strand:- start:2803 stop:3066 length:264 start_codon:yes stop_codon:yes gene_type:complete